jgi:hypothetical protein
VSTDNIQIVLTAQDKASKPIQAVQGHLKDLSKEAKGLRGLTYGVKKFAGALDTLTSSHLGGFVSDFLTVGYLLTPFDDAISGALSKVTESAKFKAASSKLGTVMGNNTVQAFGAVGLGAGIAFAFDQATQDAAGQVKALSADQAKLYNDSFASTIFTNMNQVLVANHLEGFLGPGFQSLLNELGQKAGEGAAAGVGDGMESHGYAEAVPAATRVAEAMAHALGAKEIWDKSAHGITNDLATALRGGADVIQTAMDKVMWAIQHPLEQAQQMANIQGALAMLEYQKGLHSGEQGVVDVINQQEAALKAQWTVISGNAYDAGAYAAKRWFNGYVSTWQGNKVNLPGYAGNNNTGDRPPSHHASGGWVNAGETTWVGERGPEKVTFGRGAQITPASQSTSPIHVVSADELARILDRNQGRKLALAPGSAYTRGS